LAADEEVAEMSTPMNPPPGWYPDPTGPGIRYWDGRSWTVHTQSVPTSSPVASPAAFPPPVLVARPVAPGRPLQAFLDGLKRWEAFPVMLVGGLLFAVSTFLPWADVENTQTHASDWINGWDSSGAWVVLGPSAAEIAKDNFAEGNSDLFLLMPLAIAAIVIVALVRRRRQNATAGNWAAVGLAGALGVLLVVEIVHLDGVVADLRDDFGFPVDGGASWGLYVAVVAAAVMTFGAIRAVASTRR
jgi:hypothetical protein